MSIRRLYDISDVILTSYRHWNDAMCLLGALKQNVKNTSLHKY